MKKSGMSESELLNREDPSPEILDLKKKLAAAYLLEKELKAQIGGDEMLFQYVKDSIEALQPLKTVPASKRQTKHAEHSATLMIADTHGDEFVATEEMEGMASHGLDVHQDRMVKLAAKTVEITEIVRSSAPVNDLNVWLLGDFFLGEIHPDETAYGSSCPMPLALPIVSRVLAQTIMTLSPHFRHTRVVGMCGNHGRTTRKPVYKMTADRNWDMSCYLIAKEFTCQDDRVEWVLPKSIMHVETVMGHRNLLTHGNCVNVTHRTPYFGIEDTFFKQQQARRGTSQDFDSVWMGHFHHEFSLRGFIHGMPSALGANQFSLYKMHCASAASQRVEFFTEKYGPTCGWSINLE